MLDSNISEYMNLKHHIENEVEFPKNFRELLDHACHLHPNQTALNFFQQGDNGKSLSVLELKDNTYKLADSFSKLNISKGTHVAVMLSNRIEFPITWLALAVLGAVMVPVNPAYTAKELDYLVNDSDVEFFICESQSLEVIKKMSNRPEHLVDERIIVIEGDKEGFESWEGLLDKGQSDFMPVEELGETDLLNIQYTSGTTGFPKGCMQTQRYWLLLGCVVGHLQNGEVKSILADMPYFYMDSQWMTVMGLYSGATVHCPEKPSIKHFLDWAEKYQIEMAYFPFPLLEVPASQRDAKTPIKYFLGYALNAELSRLVEERFTAIARDSFGMTEIGPGLMVPPKVDSDEGLNSCGLPTPFREAKVVGSNGVEVPDGEPGELWVKGDGIIKGYYNKPEANKESFVDGWFRTGDVFIKDNHGFFTIVGRIKDMIRRSSENISALEVEQALYFLPGVIGVAVVPVPDKKRGEEVKVYIELAENIPPNKLPPSVIVEHCKERLAAFKVPRYIEYVAELPWTPSEKVAKHKLISAKEDLRIDSWDNLDQMWR